MSENDLAIHAQYIIPWIEGDNESLSILEKLVTKTSAIAIRLLKDSDDSV